MASQDSDSEFGSDYTYDNENMEVSLVSSRDSKIKLTFEQVKDNNLEEISIMKAKFTTKVPGRDWEYEDEESEWLMKSVLLMRELNVAKHSFINNQITGTFLVTYGKGVGFPPTLEITLDDDFVRTLFAEFHHPVKIEISLWIQAEGAQDYVLRIQKDLHPVYHQTGHSVFFVKWTDPALEHKFKTGKTYFGSLDITLVGPAWQYQWNKKLVEAKLSSSHARVSEKIMTEKLLCDFELVTENGKCFPVHRAFLACASKFFARLLETEWKEQSSEKAYEVKLTEEGMEAFLKFLYCSNPYKVPIKNPGIALELLEFSRQYEISDLEEAMKKLFLTKGNKWMNTDQALLLFKLSRKVAEYGDLKWKAVQAIKVNPKGIDSSKVFDDLLKNEPDAVKEVLSLGFQIERTTKYCF